MCFSNREHGANAATLSFVIKVYRILMRLNGPYDTRHTPLWIALERRMVVITDSLSTYSLLRILTLHILKRLSSLQF